MIETHCPLLNCSFGHKYKGSTKSKRDTVGTHIYISINIYGPHMQRKLTGSRLIDAGF